MNKFLMRVQTLSQPNILLIIISCDCIAVTSLAWWGLFYGTERNGTERNDGLNHGTERFLLQLTIAETSLIS